MSLPTRWARARVLARIAKAEHGRLTVEDGPDLFELGGGGTAARLRVEDRRFWRRTLLAGTVGFADAWEDGWWSTDDLPGVLRFFARNVARRRGAGWAGPGVVRPLRRIAHALRRNTRRGARRNIEAHYDLGDDFYRLFLDRSLTYSAAWFADPDASLAEAQRAKLERVCRKLALGPDTRVVEIGSGWGAFAVHAAREHGCRVHAVTISPAQLREARRRVEAAGLAERVRVELKDWRDLEGEYDRLVSIEMIEAVGADGLTPFLRKCGELLAPDGAALLQAIVMPDRHDAEYLRSPDFIQRRIFPGSSLPSLGRIAASLAHGTDLRTVHVESLAFHYAETLRRWRRRFLRRREDARALGHSEAFLRRWEYYLAYCEAGFEERYVDDLQLVLARPACRGIPPHAAAAGGAERRAEAPSRVGRTVS